MAKVKDLQAGDLVTIQGIGMTGIFIARSEHPGYPGLQLVIWKLSNGAMSFDALLEEQEIGNIKPSTSQERGMRLMKILQQ